MKTSLPKDVDAYISSQPEETHQVLKELRKVIVATVPDAEEVIRWGAPFYKYYGLFAGFAAYKKHVRFGIVGSNLDEDIRKSLDEKGYITLERGLQVKFDQKVPTEELAQILKLKAKINESQK